MQMTSPTVDIAPTARASCALDCEACSGVCLPLYMMLTRAEQDALRRAVAARH